MIKEQSCPSCKMASTACDQSWRPAKQLWCLSRPWKSGAANSPESTVCAPLKSMTNYAPWVPEFGVHQGIQAAEKKSRPDTQTMLSLCFSLKSLTQQSQCDNQTPPSSSGCMIRHLMCVWLQHGPKLGCAGDTSSKLLLTNCSSPLAQAVEASTRQPGCSRALYFQHMDYLNS